MAHTRRLLVVEDDSLLAGLLAAALEGRGFEVRRATTAVNARKVADQFDPDVALIDIVLGDGPSGIDVAHALSRTHPGIGVVFLSQFADPIAAGFSPLGLPQGSAFLRKAQVHDIEYLLVGIESVLSERTPVEHEALDGRPFAMLTTAQLEVLRMLAQGHSNAEIAARRGTSVSATEQIVSALLRALGVEGDRAVNSRVEAVRRYVAAAGVPPRD